MTTVGQALADTIGDLLGIDSRWLFDADIQPTAITVWRGVEDSNGVPALFLASDGTVTDVARVAETFDMGRVVV